MPEIIDLTIESLSPTGDGLGRHGRERIAVPFTLPGERVRVSVGPHRADGAIGALLEVLQPSAHRVAPRCVHFGPQASSAVRDTAGARGMAGAPRQDAACGGCSWQHIAYPEQLRLKTALVTRLVQEAVPGAPPARPMITGTPIEDPWGYRHKVHFVFDGRGVMGHYVRGSRRVIEVRECPVHDERGNRIAFTLRALLQGERPHRPEGRDTVHDRPGGSRASRHQRRATRPRPVRGGESTPRSLAIRVGCHSPEIGATLVLTDDADRRLRAATRRLLEGDGAPTSLHVNLHPRDDGYVFGRETRRIAGPDRLREDVAGIAFLLSPTAFFQTNVPAAERLVRLVLDGVPAGASVLDLYAGAGLFALPLARAGHAVVAVEENRAAVADGEASARLNGIGRDRCRFLARAVEAAVSGRAPLRGDAVVLDPPREGCAREVLEAVFGRMLPAVAIYVSCNPEALARDLRLVTAHGYRIDEMQPVDMFPHTAHVETVVRLVRSLTPSRHGA